MEKSNLELFLTYFCTFWLKLIFQIYWGLSYWNQNLFCLVSHVSSVTSKWACCKSYVQLRWLNLEENLNYKVLKEESEKYIFHFSFLPFYPSLIFQLSEGFMVSFFSPHVFFKKIFNVLLNFFFCHFSHSTFSRSLYLLANITPGKRKVSFGWLIF